MSTIETDTESSLQSRSIQHITTMTGDNGLPESYHLEGGGNYGIWAYRIKNLLQKDGRFRYCITAPSDPLGEEERIARQQVLSIINSNAKNNALRLLHRYSDPYDCWLGLKTRYESDSGPRRVMLIEKFFSLRKTESVSMDAYLTEVKEITNLLEEVEVVIPKDIIVYYTLKNLPKEYEIFKRMQISAQTLPTYEQLEAKLISEETAIKMEAQCQEEGEAFFIQRDRNTGRRIPPTIRQNSAQGTNRFQRRFPEYGGQQIHRPSHSSARGGPSYSNSAAQGGSPALRQLNSPSTFEPASKNPGTYPSRFKSREPDRSRNSQCNFCNEDGHFERECDLKSAIDRIKNYEHRLLERRHRSSSGQIHNLVETSEDPKSDNEDFLADQVVDACLVELNMLETPQQTTSWYLDSGATHHVSGDSSVFSSLRPTSGAQLRSAGGQNHHVTGVGNVDLQVLNGKIKTIPSVLYTPGITKNLLSVGSLTDQQKTLVFKSKSCYVIDNATSTIEAVALRSNARGLYKLQTESPKKDLDVLSLQLRPHAVLWHRRLGHFHAKGMTRMINFGAVTGLPQFQASTSTCSSCQLGKHARTKIPKQATFHATKILELVHSDVCGPFKIRSIGGARYFTTFIDDFSRKTWVYFIAQKSQVLEKFQHFVRLVENQTGQPVRALRTDNGGEYTSRAFQDFCSSKGISRELTPPTHSTAKRRRRASKSLPPRRYQVPPP